MKSKFLFFALLTMSAANITLLPSCETRRPARFNWVGKPEHDLVLRFGPPNATRSDDNGGKIMIYVRNQAQSSQFGSTQTRKSTLYYIHPDGIIYHVLEQDN